MTYRRLTSGWVLLAYSVALVTATHWPAHFRTETRIGGISLDHIVHGMLYAPLPLMLAGFLAQRAADSFWRIHRLWLAPVILVVMAALDEWTQSAVGRTTSLNDWIGDVIGIVAVTTLLAAVSLWRRADAARRRSSNALDAP